MKKSVLLFLIFLICGCTKPQTDKDTFNIVTTVFPAFDFTKTLISDAENTEVSLLIPPGTEVHSYEPTPKDILKLEKADMLICSGGESDVWINSVVSGLDNKNLKVLKMLDFVTPIKTEHGEEDEHVWTSPENASEIVLKICEALTEQNPENSEIYLKNRDLYISDLKALDNDFKTMINSSKRKTIVFADRFPLIYFAKQYGLSYISAFSGCSENAEASPQDVSSLIDMVKKENIPIIFYIEFSNQLLADTVSEETNAEKMLFNTCHNVTKEDFENNVSYISLMRQNLISLKEALN